MDIKHENKELLLFVFIYLGIPFKRIPLYFEVTSGLRHDQIIRERIILSKRWHNLYFSVNYLLNPFGIIFY